MDLRKQNLSIQEVKEMDMVDYLSTLGIQPEKIRGNDYWYLSPLRGEKTPSFKVNRVLNRWYDHGMGRGGSIIDFGVLFYGCTVGEFLKGLRDHFSLHQPTATRPADSISQPQERKIKIIAEGSLSSPHLLRYLKHRHIAAHVAEKYCCQVHYQVGGKTYYGIGFRNDQGGYEIRNPYYKISSSPKAVTTFQNGSDDVLVFEGFMDFLSFKTMQPEQSGNDYNFLVLNSLSFFLQARSFMENHHRILLYLDRDQAGQNCTQNALSLSSRYEDHSHLYSQHKDFNDWVMNFGKAEQNTRQQQNPKKSQRLKL
ncbi:toprim domain-containing protein [Leadbetterella sp. DM7]|uniref:toprim domain-containing protein n=1 Tax=Leadbetterella sp. DM7 TaxID=3235085 RepID=UPI00349EFCB4